MYQNTTEIRRHDIETPLRESSTRLDAYKAHEIFTPFRVTQEEGSIPTVLRTNRQVMSIKRKPGDVFTRIVPTLDRKVFLCEESGIEVPITAKDVAQLGIATCEEIAAAQGADVVLRTREQAAADALFTTNTFGAGYNAAATAAWASGGTSNPLDDVEGAKEVIAKRIGAEANTVLISRALHRDLSKDAKIQSQVRAIRGYGGDMDMARGLIDPRVLADVFGVARVLIAGGVKDTANEGQAESLDWIWADGFCLVCRTAESVDDLVTPHLGRGFVFDDGMDVGTGETAMSGEAGLYGLQVETYRNSPTAEDILRTREYIDQMILLKDAGFLITGC